MIVNGVWSDAANWDDAGFWTDAAGLALTAGAVPITGSTLTLRYNKTIPVTIGSLPITGQSISPTGTIALASGTIPVTGATVVPKYAATVAISSGSLPVGGATLILRRAYAVQVTPSALPIVGATVTPALSIRSYQTTVQTGAIPITGSFVAPVYGSGSTSYQISIEAGAVPILGSSIVPIYAGSNPDITAPVNINKPFYEVPTEIAKATFLGLALHDTTHDFYLDATNNLAMVTDNRAIAEHAKQRLLFYRGEWFLDTSVGTPWFQNVFVRPHNQGIIESVIKREILNTPGVAELTSFELQIDERKRKIDVLEAIATSTLDELLEISF